MDRRPHVKDAVHLRPWTAAGRCLTDRPITTGCRTDTLAGWRHCVARPYDEYHRRRRRTARWCLSKADHRCRPAATAIHRRGRTTTMILYMTYTLTVAADASTIAYGYRRVVRPTHCLSRDLSNGNVYGFSRRTIFIPSARSSSKSFCVGSAMHRFNGGNGARNTFLIDFQTEWQKIFDFPAARAVLFSRINLTSLLKYTVGGWTNDIGLLL